MTKRTAAPAATKKVTKTRATAKPRAKAAPTVDMKIKTVPAQERSRQTYESILAVSAELMAEVGIERFSTNLVCSKAKISPPALYRYFPNKYAIFKALGSRLMDIQDKAVISWIEQTPPAKTMEEAIANGREIQRRVTELTIREPSSLWVMRAMRAVPVLRDVRIASRNKVADAIFLKLQEQHPAQPEWKLRIATRLNIEISYAGLEMSLEEPELGIDRLIEEVAIIGAAHFRLLDQAGN